MLYMFCVYIYDMWYVYICIYIYAYMIYIYIWSYIYKYIYICICICIYICIYINIYMYIYICTNHQVAIYDQPDPLSILFVSRCCEDVLMDRVVLRGRSSRWHSLECLRPGCASLLRQNRWSLGISDLAFQTRTARVKTWCVYIYVYYILYIDCIIYIYYI